jgi:hypothetical protein
MSQLENARAGLLGEPPSTETTAELLLGAEILDGAEALYITEALYGEDRMRCLGRNSMNFLLSISPRECGSTACGSPTRFTAPLLITTWQNASKRWFFRPSLAVRAGLPP